MEQCCTHIFGCTYRFSCPSDKERYNYSLPSSQETFQLLQDSAEMGMKHSLQNRKKTVEDLQDTLKTACKKYSIQERTIELLISSVSQIPSEIFQWIGKKSKSSVKSNTELNHLALRTFALPLHLYSAQAYRLVRPSLSSLETWFSSIFFNIKDLSATNFWIK